MTLHLPTESDLRIAQQLFDTARAVRERAYAPYSKFKVGAALLCNDGKIYAGCNVEAADYDGTHAEESAISAMVAAFERTPLLLAVVGASVPEIEPIHLITPCGKCRQKLMEFASLMKRDVRIFTGELKEPRIVLLSDLLPLAFGPSDFTH